MVADGTSSFRATSRTVSPDCSRSKVSPAANSSRVLIRLGSATPSPNGLSPPISPPMRDSPEWDMCPFTIIHDRCTGLYGYFRNACVTSQKRVALLVNLVELRCQTEASELTRVGGAGLNG